jgi:cytochrome bd-type quinol oxidase subunit 2
MVYLFGFGGPLWRCIFFRNFLVNRSLHGVLPFPRVSTHLSHSLTLRDASSSQSTLTVTTLKLQKLDS